jgi:F-type H+-transporting ATPase subunit b
MDALLQPNTGLVIWTVVTFLCLVLVLTKAAWKPILDGLNSRESKIKSDLERAETAQKEAEALRLKFETQLAEAQKTILSMMAEAKADGEKTRAQILTTAREEAVKIVEKGRKDLAGETDRLKGELRSEVAGLAVLIAEKVLAHSIDHKVQEQVLKDSLKEIAEVK